MHSNATSKNVSGFTLAGPPCIAELDRWADERFGDPLLKCNHWSKAKMEDSQRHVMVQYFCSSGLVVSTSKLLAERLF